MNTPDEHRCKWATAGIRSMRCMCPAVMSISDFCLFHRHAETVDAAGIVAWSQDASPEEYLARAASFAYATESPTVRNYRELIASLPAERRPSSFGKLGAWIDHCREMGSGREPGQDEQEAA